MGTSIPGSATSPEPALIPLREGLFAGLRGALAAAPARSLRRNRLALAGGAVLAVLAVVAFSVPLILRIDPYQQNLQNALLAPGATGHLLGTDEFGRDVLLRLIDAGRVSLTIGFLAVGVSVGAGGLIGLLSGYFGGWLDAILMRLIDAQLAFPGILAALVIVTVLGNGLTQAMIAVGIAGIPQYARVVRASVLSIKVEPFVESAYSLGATDRRIMLAHILPNALGPVLTLATLGLGTAILASAALSFLGVGAQPPTAEWGLMLADGRKYLGIAWWLAVFPGAAIMLTVLAINLLGDGIRDALDPRLLSKRDAA